MPTTQVRILLVCVLMALSQAPSRASTYRLAALGDNPHLLIDETNVHIYPGTLNEFPHTEVALFDNWAGAIYPITPFQVIGIQFNRRTSQLERLNTFLSLSATDTTQLLQVSPVADLQYGVVVGDRLSVGISGQVGHDRQRRNAEQRRATHSDLRLGLRFAPSSMDVIDITVGVQRNSLTGKGETIAHNPTYGRIVELRLRRSLSYRMCIVPSFGYESTRMTFSTQSTNFSAYYLTLGVNVQPTPRFLFLTGLNVSVEQQHDHSRGQLVSKMDRQTVPAVHLGVEIGIGSTLLRLGLKNQNDLTDRRDLATEGWEHKEDYQSALQIDIGLGLRFGRLAIDGLLEKDFFRDGLHIISGSRHGGGLFSSLSCSYRFYS